MLVAAVLAVATPVSAGCVANDRVCVDWSVTLNDPRVSGTGGFCIYDQLCPKVDPNSSVYVCVSVEGLEHLTTC